MPVLMHTAMTDLPGPAQLGGIAKACRAPELLGGRPFPVLQIGHRGATSGLGRRYPACWDRCWHADCESRPLQWRCQMGQISCPGQHIFDDCHDAAPHPHLPYLATLCEAGVSTGYSPSQRERGPAVWSLAAPGGAQLHGLGGQYRCGQDTGQRWTHQGSKATGEACQSRLTIRWAQITEPDHSAMQY